MRHRKISHLGIIVTFLILIAGRLMYAEDHSKFHDGNIVRNQDHIKEHLQEEVNINTTANMTKEELEFHYFEQHDLDNDTKLDGLEILAAISHMMPFEPKYPETKTAQQIRDEKIDFYAEQTEYILKENDYNNDGYLSYSEYALARRRAERGA
ncbi:multiple coagulation factor deficiency protein 2 homolog [Anneissia japonica]|uniref:multiple coagulation factor deficiency protein 2 homolog n=1 Tax=Anneissia japonica TaxID=1529436 RepID=UPI0014258E5A|nr:multiple coagulation factor deficiency protein 2 homolog [Anneissia japonica]